GGRGDRGSFSGRATTSDDPRTPPGIVTTLLDDHTCTSRHNRRWRRSPGARRRRGVRDAAPPCSGASAWGHRAADRGSAPTAFTAPTAPTASAPPVGSRGVLRADLRVHGLRTALHPPDAASAALCHVLADRDTAGSGM